MSCESDLFVVGLVDREEIITVFQVIATLTSITVTSAWFKWGRTKKLSLFFAHWLAGLVAGLGYLVEVVMVTLCWTESSLEGFIKTLKFIELSAFNMFAVTNLAICINLALVVSCHRTMSRVKSVSSPPLLLVFLVVSMGLAAFIIPLAEEIIVAGAGFYVRNTDETGNELIQICFFVVEFFVGVCMFIIVAWLLLFRLTEIKECWKLHTRIRFYFGLTLVGTAANLGIGICGTVNLSEGFNRDLIIWSWAFRYIHVALDTFVLYGVLRERNMDERGGEGDVSGSGSGGSNLPSSGRRRSKRGMSRGSRGPNNASKPAVVAPPV